MKHRHVFVFRWVIIVALLGLAALMAIWQIPNLQFDLSFGTLFVAEKGDRKAYREREGSFSGILPEFVVTATWPELVTQKQLAEFDAVRRKIKTLPAVYDSYSLSDSPAFRGAEFAGGRNATEELLRDLFSEVPLIEIASTLPELGGRFVSNDGRSLAMWLRADRDANKVTEQIRSLVEPDGVAHAAAGSDAPAIAWRTVGPGLVLQAMRDAMKRDLFVTVLMQVILLAIVLPMVFRTVRGGVVPIASLLIAVLLYLGGLVWFGVEIGVLGVAVPGLMAVIVVCDSVHLMHRFEEALQAGADRRSAVATMLRDTGPACFWTSATTAFGFAALGIAEHMAVRSFGLVAAAGVGVAYLVVILFTPALLSVWPVRHRARLLRHDDSAGGKPVWWARRPTRLVALLLCALLGLGLFGLTRVEVNNRLLGELPDRTRAVQDFRWFEDQFGGLLRMQFDVKGDLLDAANFAAVEGLVTALAEDPDVTHVESYTEYLGAFADAEPSTEDLFVASQILRGFGGLPRHVFQDDLEAGRLIFFTKDLGSTRHLELVERAEALIATFPASLSVEETGPAALAHSGIRLVVTTLIRSLSLSFFVITIVIAFAFRSWRFGLLAFPSNVLPILVAIAMAGWIGIELRIGVVVVFCIGFGLAVDDTIHFLSRYRVVRRSGAGVDASIHQTLHSTGHALVQTSLVLGIGAISYFFASFQSIQDTGALLLTMVVVALVADLVLLPFLFRRWPDS